MRRLTFLFAALMVAGCRAQQNVFAPRGPAANRLASLGESVIGTFLVATVIMYVLIVWLSVRRKGSLAEHEPADAGGGENWILIGGFLIPAMILMVFFVMALTTMKAFPLHDGHTDHQADIIVTGHQWWWEAEYISGALCRPAGTPDLTLGSRMKTANELHIPVGQPVEIALHSNDVIHSFWIPQLHGKVDVVPGQENRIRIVASQPGRYRGQCAEYCGEQHAHMALFITADMPEDFNRWMLAQRAPAAAPETAEQARGKELFEEKACAVCHTIRGTEAGGTVGPDLTHVGSRPTIAAGSLPNNPAYLEAWVTHAQSLKPGAEMPDLTIFNGEDLRAVVAYLQHLR